MPDRVYFDSCIFIELLQRKVPDRLEACEALRAAAVKGDLVIVTSALAIAEVNKLKESTSLPEEQSKQILAFFENEYIAVRPASREIGEYAHQLARAHKLGTIDAIHVATAVKSQCSVLYTYDGMTKKRDGLLKHDGKIGSPPISIKIPPNPFAGTLLDPAKMSTSLPKDGAAAEAKPKLVLPYKGEVAASPPAGATAGDDTGASNIRSPEHASDAQDGKTEEAASGSEDPAKKETEVTETVGGPKDLPAELSSVSTEKGESVPYKTENGSAFPAYGPDDNEVWLYPFREVMTDGSRPPEKWQYRAGTDGVAHRIEHWTYEVTTIDGQKFTVTSDDERQVE